MVRKELSDYFSRNEESVYYYTDLTIGTICTVGGIAGIVNGLSKMKSGDNEGLNDIIFTSIPIAIGLKYLTNFAIKTYIRMRQ